MVISQAFLVIVVSDQWSVVVKQWPQVWTKAEKTIADGGVRVCLCADVSQAVNIIVSNTVFVSKEQSASECHNDRGPRGWLPTAFCL